MNTEIFETEYGAKWITTEECEVEIDCDIFLTLTRQDLLDMLDKTGGEYYVGN